MPAYLFSMPQGIPGQVTRGGATVQAEVASESVPSAYGLPTVIDATTHKVRAVGASDTTATGILVRPYPTQSSTNDFGPAAPPTSGMVGNLRRGYVMVKNNAGTPANGGQVYVRVANASGAKVIGGIEAAASGTDGADTITIPATFVGPADSDGTVEIAFNL